MANVQAKVKTAYGEFSDEQIQEHRGTHYLEARDITCGYDKPVLKHVSLKVASGDVICLLGPNGIGKTTLFKTLLGFLKPMSGTVIVDGVNRETLTRKQLAQKVAYVPQLHTTPFDFTLLDVVLTGAAAHLAAFEAPKEQDYTRADRILEDLGISHLAQRSFTHLSGGEQQMGLIARSLMQNSNILVMDEPTAALDLGNQVRVLSTIEGMAQDGHAIVMTSHNPDQAFLCSTKALLIVDKNHIVAGSVDKVVTEENLSKVYGVPIRVTQTTNLHGDPIKTCIPLLC